MQPEKQNLQSVCRQVEKAGRSLIGGDVFCHLKTVPLSRPLLKHRKLFRQEVLNWLTLGPGAFDSLSPVQKKSFLSPGGPVIFEEEGKSLCLSHCPFFMGCVFRQGGGKVSLGFDLEKPDRLKSCSRTLERVASARERDQAPHPVALWSAKEAAFKSLKGTTSSLKSISLFNWQRENSHTFRYEFAPPPARDFVPSARDFVPPPGGGGAAMPRLFSSAEASLKGPGGRGVVLFFDFVLVCLAGLWF